MFWMLGRNLFMLVIVTSYSDSQTILPTSTSCSFSEKSDVFYSRNASHYHGSMIRSFDSTNQTECQRSCCRTFDCTLYMFSTVLHEHNPNITVNCFLFFCGIGNDSLCVVKPLPENATGISVVGIRQDKTGDISVIKSSSRNETTDKLHVHSSSVHSTHSHPGMNTLSSILNTSLVRDTPVYSSSVQVGSLNESQNKFLDNSTSHKTDLNHLFHVLSSLGHISTISLEIAHLTPHLDASSTSLPFSSVITNHTTLSSKSYGEVLSTQNSTTDILSKPSSDLLGVSQVPNTSQSFTASHSSTLSVKQNTKKKFSEGHSHTTPASLVISLIIGILFFGAVVFLIARRWGETCFRRGYSRVDYLLNDYD